MTYKNQANLMAFKGKTRFLILAISCLALLTGSVAGGEPQQAKRSLSCKTLRTMARVYMAYGEYTKAQPLAERALTLAQKNCEPDSEIAMCLIDLATLYKNQNNLLDAEKMCKLGLELQKKALYEKHPYVAYTFRTLGAIYQEQGKYDKAGSALDEAMAIMLDSHTENDRALVPFWVDIAGLLVAKRDFEEAESYYHRAMALINISYGPEHLYTANVLGSVARLYTLQGRYDEAEELIDRTVATQEKIYGPDNHLIAPSWLTKARVCQAKGDHVRSETLIQKALSAVRKTGNTAIYTKLEQRAEEIRAGGQTTSGPVAKAVGS
ncbi:MAG TPA: tetratricopeptide repeat protein [Sedimentisphaerales bacterium]|nr:tetratricopeptide repeat protein [Sedimentisphaerales bacterium]